ncbi:CAP protein [Ascosphaera apis ARSEF 7405]|uniref:Adenylyl cyclase-associated protein n=1 Tax=Ascosphaera apis ARSEF 7405 TaxID=392613 RepID=A0A168BFD0_9EURO|nr:CAP protein [Ascosphaera apis ARSEF 7405]
MVNNGNQMNNFTTLIKRLEAATSRLEDMASTLESSNESSAAPQRSPSSPYPPPAHPSPAHPHPHSHHPSPAQPKSSSSGPAAGSPAVSGSSDVPKTVQEFDDIINTDVKEFVELGEKLGEPVSGQAKAILRAFEAERTYILVAAKAKKPDNPSQSAELLADLRSASEEINNIRENNRPSPLFNHLSAVAEGIMALGWFFESKPVDFVKETFGSSQFYGNRVLKEQKEKEDGEAHVAFIQAYYKLFRSLTAYIQKNFLGGLVWNNKDGIDPLDALREAKNKQPASTGPSHSTPAPPPPPGPAPPPPPPLPTFDLAQGSGSPSKQGGDMSEVFNQLNQGEGITSSLRHVDKSEMTHKNPNLRAQSTVPARPSSSGGSSTSSRPPSKKPKPESMRAKKPPKKVLNGNKWSIENYDNHEGIIEIEATLQQSILISHCNKSIIKVSNKANAITIDNCTGLSIIVDSLISSLEIIKSPKFQLQIDGAVPTLLLEQVDGATIYLSEASLGSEFVSSKCSNINIILPPKEGSDEDGKECPVPEQIRTTIKNGALVNEVVEHVA